MLRRVGLRTRVCGSFLTQFHIHAARNLPWRVTALSCKRCSQRRPRKRRQPRMPRGRGLRLRRGGEDVDEGGWEEDWRVNSWGRNEMRVVGRRIQKQSPLTQLFAHITRRRSSSQGRHRRFRQRKEGTGGRRATSEKHQQGNYCCRERLRRRQRQRGRRGRLRHEHGQEDRGIHIRSQRLEGKVGKTQGQVEIG